MGTNSRSKGSQLLCLSRVLEQPELKQLFLARCCPVHGRVLPHKTRCTALKPAPAGRKGRQQMWEWAWQSSPQPFAGRLGQGLQELALAPV